MLKFFHFLKFHGYFEYFKSSFRIKWKEINKPKPVIIFPENAKERFLGNVLDLLYKSFSVLHNKVYMHHASLHR